MEKEIRQKKITELAQKIIRLSKDHILMHMRFLDVAMAAITPKPKWGMDSIACDGRNLLYDPVWVVRRYRQEQGAIVRAYLHVLLHMIFFHGFRYDRVDRDGWNLACDMAVENTIMEFAIPNTQLKRDREKREVIRGLQREGIKMNAEKIYRFYKEKPLDIDVLTEYLNLFQVDDHEIWKETQQMNLSLSDWKKMTERIKADLKSFSDGKTKSEGMMQNLEAATRDHVDYSAFLKRFVVSGEAMHVSEDEFDYIYYHYGLFKYGNMPLIEPLEYQEVQKIQDFVIVIDTSASCRGKTVRAFLNKTYSIMKTEGAFFEDMNVHILQCDHEVRKDTVIHNEAELDQYLMGATLTGFGSTDFRPAFHYVDEKIRQGVLQNLKGLIYFTDGYGIFPAQMPEYDTVFVFLREDDTQPPIPSWAVKIVLDGELDDEY